LITENHIIKNETNFLNIMLLAKDGVSLRKEAAYSQHQLPHA